MTAKDYKLSADVLLRGAIEDLSGALEDMKRAREDENFKWNAQDKERLAGYFAKLEELLNMTRRLLV